MELWDLYDEQRRLVGTDHIRGEELPDNCFHLVVHVWIKNSKGEYLISQRAADRPTFPLLWECVGGSVLKGETSLQGALREVKEEVGLDLDGRTGKVIFTKIRKTVGQVKCNDIMDVWLFPYNEEVLLEKATTREVSQTRWASYEDIRKLWEQNLFVPSLYYFFGLENV
ncbi:predicted transcriptional regulator [Clostridium sp. CAG:1013]|nr:predicted transcriptional regulator [Clostridium sp. CAG:1013]